MSQIEAGRERPILFSAPMVRAILDGKKTATRRALRTQPLDILTPRNGSPRALARVTRVRNERRVWFGLTVRGERVEDNRGTEFYCRHGEVGDRLWVRETWTADFGFTFSDHEGAWWHEMPRSLRTVKAAAYLYYAADDSVYHGPYHGKDLSGPPGPLLPSDWEPTASDLEGRRWVPSIHMPRWASRITLEITGVRVERLQEITEEDAQAEGRTLQDLSSGGPGYFPHTWDELNAARGFGWDVNPWVWVIDFSVLGALKTRKAGE